jgi:hypothetical protein
MKNHALLVVGVVHDGIIILQVCEVNIHLDTNAKNLKIYDNCKYFTQNL